MGVTTKSTALAPVPSPSVTVTGPVVAPTGTFAVIWVSLSTLKDDAGVPLKATAFATLESSKPVPVIVTDVPVGPVMGRKTTTRGAAARAAGATASSAPANASASAAPTVAVLRCQLYIAFHLVPAKRRSTLIATLGPLEAGIGAGHRSFHGGKSPDSGREASSWDQAVSRAGRCISDTRAAREWIRSLRKTLAR
jgi:hypothetical protein